MKLYLLSVFVAVAAATEEAAEEAAPEAPAAVVPHQQFWPGARLPGFSGTCWGCRPGVAHPLAGKLLHPHFLGKRSAEAEAGHLGYYGYYGYPYGYYGYPLAVESSYESDLPGDSSAKVSITHLVGKRSAEPGHLGYYGYPYGYYGFYHPIAAVKSGYEHDLQSGKSSVSVERTHLIGKRSAEPGHVGFYGYPYGFYGYPLLHPLPLKAAEASYESTLPGDSSAKVSITSVVAPGHHLYKRSAEPGHFGYYGYPYGYYGYPYVHALKPLKSGTAIHPGLATSFVERSPQGASA